MDKDTDFILLRYYKEYENSALLFIGQYLPVIVTGT
jgi:hypothetical protein